jgi:hypothetical protein
MAKTFNTFVNLVINMHYPWVAFIFFEHPVHGKHPIMKRVSHLLGTGRPEFDFWQGQDFFSSRSYSD